MGPLSGDDDDEAGLMGILVFPRLICEAHVEAADCLNFFWNINFSCQILLLIINKEQKYSGNLPEVRDPDYNKYGINYFCAIKKPIAV